jgi:hypothetical protein
MKKIGIHILLFLAISSNSNGQDSFVLEGMIGEYPIIMKLSREEPGYFYKSRRRNIELEMSDGKKDSIILKETDYDGKLSEHIKAEVFVLLRTGNEWKGNWKTSSGITLPVLLKPIDTSQYNFKAIPDFDLTNNNDRIYTKAQLSNLDFIKDSVTRYGNYQLQWLHEKRTELSGFRIISGYDEASLRKVNDALAEQQYSHINNYLKCGDNRGEPDYELSVYCRLISPEFISVESYNYFYCGGAHPVYDNSSFTIDVKTGSEIKSIDELYWFTGEKPVSEHESESEKYYNYIATRAKRLVAILTGLYPHEMKKPASQDSCDYSVSWVWEFPSWYLTEKGLYIIPSFSQASHACDYAEFSFIPYTFLSTYKNPERK